MQNNNLVKIFETQIQKLNEVSENSITCDHILIDGQFRHHAGHFFIERERYHPLTKKVALYQNMRVPGMSHNIFRGFFHSKILEQKIKILITSYEN